MKKIPFLIVFILIVFINWQSQAQPSATPAQLQKHNLTWITSTADFDQTNLSKEVIDTSIMRLIRNAIGANKLNMDIEIPINSKELIYLGYKHPNETGLFDANKISRANNNTPELDTLVHIYQYGNFYVSTEADSPLDQANVYYAIRAINILRARYPEAFYTMFTSTMKFATETPKFQKWVNSNKAFWIAFNNNPAFIASNNTIFLGDGYFSNTNNTIGKYRNVALVNVDSRNILGDLENIGSRPIYRKQVSWDNYYNYMKEGLLESLNHEMGHNYIDLAYTYDDRFQMIRSNRGKLNFNLAEEIAILNTSIPFFTKHGGFTDNLSNYYYRVTFNPNIEQLRKANQLVEYGKAFSDIPVTDQSLRQVFKLPILAIQDFEVQIDTSDIKLVILNEHYIQDGFTTNPRAQQDAQPIPAFRIDSSFFEDHNRNVVKIFKEVKNNDTVILYSQIKHPGDLPTIDLRKPVGSIPANQVQSRCPENQQRMQMQTQPRSSSYTTVRAFMIKGEYRDKNEIAGKAFLIKEICVAEVEQYAKKQIFLRQLIQ